MHPRGEVEVERAVTIEVDQRHVADAPGLHLREVDLLELEPAAEVRVEEHAERAADRDVRPSVVVHVSGGERTEVHRPRCHRLVERGQREPPEAHRRALEATVFAVTPRAVALEGRGPQLEVGVGEHPMGGGRGRRQRLELGRAPPHRKRGRRRAGGGEAGERRGPSRLVQVVPVVDHPGHGAGQHPCHQDRRRGHAPDAPGERRAEEAPGVDAVRPERHQQHRDHLDRHPGAEEHRAHDDVERHRDGEQDAEDAGQQQHRRVRRAALDARDVVQDVPGEDLDQDRSEDAGEEHQRERGDDHPPEVADVVEHHPSQRAHGAGRRWPAPPRPRAAACRGGPRASGTGRARAVVTRPAARGTSRGARRVARARARPPGR